MTTRHKLLGFSADLAAEAGIPHGAPYYWVGPVNGAQSLYSVSPIFRTPAEAKAWQAQNGSEATAAKGGGWVL